MVEVFVLCVTGVKNVLSSEHAHCDALTGLGLWCFFLPWDEPHGWFCDTRHGGLMQERDYQIMDDKFWSLERLTGQSKIRNHYCREKIRMG